MQCPAQTRCAKLLQPSLTHFLHGFLFLFFSSLCAGVACRKQCPLQPPSLAHFFLHFEKGADNNQPTRGSGRGENGGRGCDGGCNGGCGGEWRRRRGSGGFIWGANNKIVISRRVVAFGLSSSGGRPRQRRGTLGKGRTGRINRNNRKLNCRGLGW